MSVMSMEESSPNIGLSFNIERRQDGVLFGTSDGTQCVSRGEWREKDD